ncbi:hypothetical protein ACP70R_004465 [Stipagrostis hirtigluma subsp. patula]
MTRESALVALAALLPTLAAAAVAVDRRFPLSPGHMCGSQGRYAPFSAYEANLRRLAAAVAADVNTSARNCSAGRVAGDRPDQVSASAFCYWRPDASSPDCGACVALPFREARWRCPYHRQAVAVAVVDGGACSVSFHDVRRMELDRGEVHGGSHRMEHHRGEVRDASFRAGYVLFGWVSHIAGFLNQDALLILLFQAAGLAFVVFLFLQEWRARNRGPISNDDYLPVTGDQL